MPIAPYDPAAGGPSQAAMVSTMQYQNNLTDQANRDDANTQEDRLKSNFLGLNAAGKKTGFGGANALASSLGASGNLYSGSGQYQEGQAQTQYENTNADIESAYNRAHMELKRNEAFAAIGLIL